MKKKSVEKLWGGAFNKSPSDAVIDFTAGRDVKGLIPVDYKLLSYDIWVNKVHCLMLEKQGIITKVDSKTILKGLQEIGLLVQKGKFILDPQKEDVHTNIESWLIKKYGIDVAGKLHTARSRNDQITADMRLYMRDQALKYTELSISLARSLLAQADAYKKYVMPGFTHHQPAMVTTLGHVLLSFASMISRDSERFSEWMSLHNRNPLGSIVSYGTSFNIDQDFTTKLFGFDEPEMNSLDGITNRWEPEADLAFAISIFMNHLSHIAQTFIMLSMPQFNMIKLSDEYSTGSSIMPQKKNPDPLEVIKGKASMVSGQLHSLLNIGRGNFIGYNRDSQWTKYIICDVVDECILAPVVMIGILETMKVNKAQMEFWANKGFITATSLLEQIVVEFKLPFRKAKIIIEKAVKYSENHNTIIMQGLKKALKEEDEEIAISEKQLTEWQNPIHILRMTKSAGSPGLEPMRIAIRDLSEKLNTGEKWLREKTKEIKTTHDELNKVFG